MYLSTLEVQPGVILEQEEVEEILARFFPKLGMVLDVDFTKMQARLEQKVVKGLYRPRFSKNTRLFDEKTCIRYFMKRYQKIDFFLLEGSIFRALIIEVCKYKHLNREKSLKQFAPNEYVQSWDWQV